MAQPCLFQQVSGEKEIPICCFFLKQEWINDSKISQLSESSIYLVSYIIYNGLNNFYNGTEFYKLYNLYNELFFFSLKKKSCCCTQLPSTDDSLYNELCFFFFFPFFNSCCCTQLPSTDNIDINHKQYFCLVQRYPENNHL